MHLLLALALSAFDPVFCEDWKITERDGKVSYSSRETIGGFQPESHYVISAEMRAAEPGTVALGVDSWHGAYKRHYYKQVKLPVSRQWRTQKVYIATPSIREYPVFSNRTTRAVAYFGPKGFEMRNWKMRRLDARDVATEHPTLEFVHVPSERQPAFARNKVANSSFELGMAAHGTYEEIPAEGGTHGKAEIDDEVAWHGKRSLRLDTRESQRPFAVKSAECWLAEGSRDCVYSVWLKADRPTKVHVSLMDVSTDYPTGNASWKSTGRLFDVGTNWVRHAVAYGNSPLANRKYTPIVELRTPAQLWIDAEQFESGTVAREYAPAAEQEAAYVLDETLFVQACGERVRRSVEFRTVDYRDGRNVRAATERRAFFTSRYGKFKFEGMHAGHPAYPAEYTVIQPLAVKACAPRDLAREGFYCGVNGGPEMNAGKFKSLSGGTLKEYVRQLRLFGVRMLRLHDSYPQWPQCEPEKGKYDWRALDAYVEACRENGIEPMYVLGNYALLAWDDPKKDAHRDWFVRRNSRNTGHRAVWGRHSMVPSMDDWLDFTRALAKRYRGKIKYYEVINEPNLQVVDPGEYAKLLKASFGAFRECDPDALVVGVSATGDYGADAGGFLEAVGKAGGFAHFDILSFHPYASPMDFSYPPAEELLATVRRIADSYRPGCRMLNDELYFLCDYAKNPLAHNRAWNWPARNYPRRLAIDAAGGCEGSTPLHVTRFWQGDPSHPGEGWAAWNAFYHSPSDVAVAGNAFAAMLEGARFESRPRLPAGFAGADFRAADGRKVRMAWAVCETDARLLPLPEGMEAFDMFGNPLDGGDVFVGQDPVYLRDAKPPARREIEVSSRYLELPVRNGGKPYRLTVRDGGRNAVEPADVQLSADPHWWALMDVGGFKGRTLTLEAPAATAEALKLVRQRDGIPSVDMTGDAFRPQFHYSPARGWVNDPNGLTWVDGEWRLFYQHNPYGACWGNMHWGYAASRDLVNWREMSGNALSPDESGAMYSGCGLVDADNVAGFGKGAHLLYYTATGRKMVQSLAYSLDGRKYAKYSANPLIGQFAPGNRDPKIFRYRPDGHWVMVLCGVQNERHAVFIFTSKDLKNWERASTFLSGDCTDHDDWMFECPGLEELAIEGESATAWVMWGAGCDYTVGEFDGKEFKAVETGLPGIVRSGKAKPYYAGQTYANVPDGRVVWQAWYRLPYGPSSPFAHCFSLPQELSLRRTAEGLRMVRHPARELAALRETSELALDEFEGELAEVELSCKVAPAGRLKLKLRGVELEYDAAESTLAFGGERLEWPAPDGKLALRIYLDRVGAEIFSGDGLSMAALPKIMPPPSARRLEKISAEGVADFAAQAWRLKSIWR